MRVQLGQAMSDRRLLPLDRSQHMIFLTFSRVSAAYSHTFGVLHGPLKDVSAMRYVQYVRNVSPPIISQLRESLSTAL